MPTKECCNEIPFFKIEQVPQLTALASSVYATMLFPGDEQGLDRLACAQTICLDWRARYAGDQIEEVLPVARRELLAVLDFAQCMSFQKLKILGSDAISAGQILKFVLLLDQTKNLEASLRKAVDLLLWYEQRVNHRTLMDRWRRFKSAAHLWAAYNDYTSGLKSAGPEWQITAWLSFMKDPRPVLAIAEHYRDWAVNHTPKRSRGKRTLDPLKTWRIPEGIGELPQLNFLNPQIFYEGLAPEAHELTSRYRHG